MKKRAIGLGSVLRVDLRGEARNACVMAIGRPERGYSMPTLVVTHDDRKFYTAVPVEQLESV